MPPRDIPAGWKKVYGVWVHPDSVPRQGSEPNIGDYRTWRDWKLKRELEQRGLSFPDDLTKGNMAKALRKHDEDEEVFGPGPYSAFTTPANSPSTTGRRKSPVLPEPIGLPRKIRAHDGHRGTSNQPPDSPKSPFREDQMKGILQEYVDTNDMDDRQRDVLRDIIGSIAGSPVSDDGQEESGLIIPVFSDDDVDLAESDDDDDDDDDDSEI